MNKPQTAVDLGGVPFNSQMVLKLEKYPTPPDKQTMVYFHPELALHDLGGSLSSVKKASYQAL